MNQAYASARQSQLLWPRFEEFTEEDVENVLIAFECVPLACQWQKLSAKARGAYVVIDDCLDYGNVKSAILHEYAAPCSMSKCP